MSDAATASTPGPIPMGTTRAGTAEEEIGARVSDVLRAHLLAGSSLRSLAETLGINAETLRRMYLNQRPSAQLLSLLCEKCGVSGDWLLMGIGPQMKAEIIQECLRNATAPELCQAVARRWRDLQEQIERITLLHAPADARASTIGR